MYHLNQMLNLGFFVRLLYLSVCNLYLTVCNDKRICRGSE